MKKKKRWKKKVNPQPLGSHNVFSILGSLPWRHWNHRKGAELAEPQRNEVVVGMSHLFARLFSLATE